ncbi:hypothetical protein MM5_206 [Morganella phage vB_Mm5]
MKVHTQYKKRFDILPDTLIELESYTECSLAMKKLASFEPGCKIHIVDFIKASWFILENNDREHHMRRIKYDDLYGRDYTKCVIVYRLITGFDSIDVGIFVATSYEHEDIHDNLVEPYIESYRKRSNYHELSSFVRDCFIRQHGSSPDIDIASFI